MADEIKVTPTPIQRNLNDVVMELTELFYTRQTSQEYTVEKIQEVYKKFYATVRLTAGMDSEELEKILGK